jgi:hypothetical protein
VTTSAQLTATGTTLGTPNYMAPEQAMGKPVGPWSDLYSVGVIAFEMLVGEVPFRDTEEPMAVLMRQVNEPIPPVASLRPEVDPAVSDWVDRLLVKEPGRRTRSAVEAWRGLEEALITALGPRWNRQAGLAAGANAAVPPFETPATARLAAGGGTRATTGMRAGRRTPATARLREPGRTPILDPGPSAATQRPRTTAPPAPSGRPRRRHRWRAAAALLALLPVIAGVALAAGAGNSGSGHGSRGAPTAVTSTRALTLAVPAGWKPLDSVPATGLPLSDALALAPGGREDRPAIVYGLMPATNAGNSTLLPPAFLASLGRPASQVPPRKQVTLADQALPAWRYRKLRPLGSSRQLTAYVVPTDAGIATVACLAPPAGGRPLPAHTCDAIASTLHLRHARPYPIGPSDAYAAALTSNLGSLRRGADGHEQSLSVAATKGSRSRAAKALASDYDRASRRFAALPLSPADYEANQTLVSALRRVSSAYAALARAAAHRSRAAVSRALATALRDEKAIDEALAALRAAGYSATTNGAQTSPSQSSSPSTGGSKCPADDQSDDPSDDAGDCQP